MLLGTVNVVLELVLTFLQTLSQCVDIQQSKQNQGHLDHLDYV